MRPSVSAAAIASDDAEHVLRLLDRSRGKRRRRARQLGRRDADEQRRNGNYRNYPYSNNYPYGNNYPNGNNYPYGRNYPNGNNYPYGNNYPNGRNYPYGGGYPAGNYTYGNGNAPYGNSRGYGNQAANVGYQDGIMDGRNDRMTGHSFRPTHDDNYKHADRGYSSAFGNKNMYKQQYRSGYERGYPQGYGR